MTSLPFENLPFWGLIPFFLSMEYFDIEIEYCDERDELLLMGLFCCSGEEAHAVDGVRAESSLEAEMVMIRRALDGKIPNTKEAKDTFLHEFSKLRTRQVELLNTLTIAKNSLQQVNMPFNCLFITKHVILHVVVAVGYSMKL